MTARLIGARGREGLAPQPLEVAQVGELHLPVPIGRQIGREAGGVVESAEQLLHEKAQLPRGVEPSS
jgi:hypothetical protein